MSLDSLAAARNELIEQVLRGPGEATQEMRAGAASATGAGLPAELASLVEKIHRHAYRVTDEELASLRARYSEDVLFEITVAASISAAEQRFLAGLRAVEEAG
jgi:alkylhydroperoxidase family enzyme